jgi:hypothetical protein
MIGTPQWFLRWAAPMGVAALGLGAVVGAGIWRFSDYPELAAAKVSPSITVTVTTTPPLGDLSQLSAVTKTATPEPKTLQAVVPRAETSTVAAPAETVTTTTTVTKTEEANDGDNRTRGNSNR